MTSGTSGDIKFAELGENEVRRRVETGAYAGKNLRFASAWLSSKENDDNRQREEFEQSLLREHVRISKSSKNAAWVAAVAAIVAAVVAIISSLG